MGNAEPTLERIRYGFGASATDRGLGLDRHWRNARTIASHNPVLYKARNIGDYSVNGRVPEYVWAIGKSAALS